MREQVSQDDEQEVGLDRPLVHLVQDHVAYTFITTTTLNQPKVTQHDHDHDHRRSSESMREADGCATYSASALSSYGLAYAPCHLL